MGTQNPDYNCDSRFPAGCLSWGPYLILPFDVAMCPCYCTGITDAPLYKKTDKSKPMGLNVAVTNAIGGQPTERGSSPILYAAAAEELNGMSFQLCALIPSAILCKVMHVHCTH